MTSFPINEDRTKTLGRYVITKTSDGKFHSRWESEWIIQTALADAKTSVPSAPVYDETPLKVRYPEYGQRLVEDAIKKGVPVNEAVAVFEQHVRDVTNRLANEVTRWDGIAPKSSNAPKIEPPSTTTSVTDNTDKLCPIPTQQTVLASEIASQAWFMWTCIAGAIALVLSALFLLKKQK